MTVRAYGAPLSFAIVKIAYEIPPFDRPEKKIPIDNSRHTIGNHQDAIGNPQHTIGSLQNTIGNFPRGVVNSRKER